MKRNYLIFGIIGIIVLVAILTNPNQNRHKEVIKNKLNSYMQKSMSESETDNEWEQAGQALGMMLGGALVDRIIDNIVSTDNYVLFSTTKINWKGQTKVIGIGIFGNVYVTSKLDKVMETDSTNQDFDQSKFLKETQNESVENNIIVEDNKTSLSENLIEKGAQVNEDFDCFSNDDIVVNGISYGQYSNSKFKFSIPYPKDFIVEKSSENGDGRVFSGKNAELKVYGSLTNLNMDIKELFERSKEKEKENNSQVSYERLVDNWFVLSGYNENGKIYYQKTVHDENDADITAILTFEESEKQYYEKMIKYIFKNLETNKIKVMEDRSDMSSINSQKNSIEKDFYSQRLKDAKDFPDGVIKKGEYIREQKSTVVSDVIGLDLLPENMQNYLGKYNREQFEKIVGEPVGYEDHPNDWSIKVMVYNVMNTYTSDVTAIRCVYRESDGKLISVRFGTRYYLGYAISFGNMKGFYEAKNYRIQKNRRGEWLQANYKLGNFGMQMRDIRVRTGNCVINYHIAH